MSETSTTQELPDVAGQGISIIVPTYREVENIPHLLARLATLQAQHEGPFEVLFMDDDSQDGSVEAVAAAGYDWAQIIVRTSDRGLSPAVLEGFARAQHDILV